MTEKIVFNLTPLIHDLQKSVQMIEELLAKDPPQVDEARKLLAVMRTELPNIISAGRG
jgi:hypothetical protein